MLIAINAASAGISEEAVVVVDQYTKAKYGKEIPWRGLPQDEQARLRAVVGNEK